MRPWNITAAPGADGGETLALDVFGVVGDGFWDDVQLAEIARQLTEHPAAKRIDVRINSVGGDLFAGVAIYNLLRAHGAEIVAHVVGQAASTASIIAMAGRTIMHRGSMLMVHNPWAVVAGDARELRRVAADLDKAREGLVAIYQAKTGKDAAALRSLLDAETWMTAEQAKRNGFADEIAEKPVAAEARGEQVVVAGVPFPRDRVAAPILALAAAAPPEPAPAQQAAPLTREALAEQAPDVLAAILAEGEAAGFAKGRAEGEAAGFAKGVAAERARIQAIDELPVRGHAKLVFAAKYGEKPLAAPELAMAMLKAEGEQRDHFLADRVTESAAAAGVPPASPRQTDGAAESRHAVSVIAAGGSARRGGGGSR